MTDQEHAQAVRSAAAALGYAVADAQKAGLTVKINVEVFSTSSFGRRDEEITCIEASVMRPL